MKRRTMAKKRKRKRLKLMQTMKHTPHCIITQRPSSRGSVLVLNTDFGSLRTVDIIHERTALS